MRPPTQPAWGFGLSRLGKRQFLMYTKFMYQAELDLMMSICRDARPLAMEYFSKNEALEVIQKNEPDGRDSPVTEADKALDAYLKEKLMAARPDYGWLSEETVDDPARLSKSHVWVVDPIDGTRGFIEGSDTWTISVGLVVNNEAVAGVVYAPVRDEMIAAHINGDVIHTGDKQPYQERTIMISVSEHRQGIWDGVSIEDWATAVSNSTAYKMAQVGAGNADADLCFRPRSEWDLAAAAAICKAGGAIMTTVKGQPIPLNQANPETDCGLLTATPKAYAELIQKINF